MTTIKFTIVLLLGVLAGCQKQPNEGGVQSAPAESVCKPICEGQVYAKRIDTPGGVGSKWQGVALSPAETASLKAAMTDTKVSGDPQKVHVHADVTNGQLVFSPDRTPEPAHVSGSEPEVSFGKDAPATSSIPVKVVASPAAAQLLRQKEIQPPGAANP